MKQTYSVLTHVKTNDFNKEYAQKVSQEKIDTQNLLEIEDIIDIQDYNEDFGDHYIYGRREKAVELLDYIDLNYNNGYFLTIAAQRGDKNMLERLIEKGANVNIDNESALTAAANRKYEDCIKLLIREGANPDKLKFTTAYPIIQKCLQEMQSQES